MGLKNGLPMSMADMDTDCLMDNIRVFAGMLLESESAKKEWSSLSKEHHSILTDKTVKNVMYNLPENISYAEIGGGDGGAFMKNVETIGIDRNVVERYNVDVMNHMPHSGVTYISSAADLPPVDVLVCKMSLHHIPDVCENVLNNIQSQYLVIREHNVKNARDRELVEIQHYVYSLLEGIDMSWDEYRESSGLYLKSRRQWNNLLSVRNYDSVWSNDDPKNVKPDRAYTEIFVMS